jgi:uncharacterized cupredoxin-like copper-binding protein
MAKVPSRREQRYLQAKARRRRQIVAGLGAVVVAVVVVVVIVIASGGGGESTVVARLTLDDYTITGDLEVPAGGEIELVALNAGEVPHNVGLRGGRIGRDLPPGEQGSVNIGELVPGTYELYCDIAGHVELGMVATLTVTDPPPEGG